MALIGSERSEAFHSYRSSGVVHIDPLCTNVLASNLHGVNKEVVASSIVVTDGNVALLSLKCAHVKLFLLPVSSNRRHHALSSDVVLKSGEVLRCGAGSRNINTVVLDVVSTQVGNVELESSGEVNLWRNQPVVNTKWCERRTRVIHALRCHARLAIGSKELSATHVVLSDRHYSPAVDVPALRSSLGLEALVKTSLLAIAEVVGRCIASPVSNSTVLSDVGNYEVLGQSEAQWSVEGSYLAPSTNTILLAAVGANIYAVVRVLLQVGKSDEWLVNLNGCHVDGIGSEVALSIDYLEEVLLLISRNPAYGSAVVGDVLNHYAGWAWASNRANHEGGEQARGQSGTTA